MYKYIQSFSRVGDSQINVERKHGMKHVSEIVEQLFAKSTTSLSKTRTSRSAYMYIHQQFTPVFIFLSLRSHFIYSSRAAKMDRENMSVDGR